MIDAAQKKTTAGDTFALSPIRRSLQRIGLLLLLEVWLAILIWFFWGFNSGKGTSAVLFASLAFLVVLGPLGMEVARLILLGIRQFFPDLAEVILREEEAPTPVPPQGQPASRPRRR